MLNIIGNQLHKVIQKFIKLFKNFGIISNGFLYTTALDDSLFCWIHTYAFADTEETWIQLLGYVVFNPGAERKSDANRKIVTNYVIEK